MCLAVMLAGCGGGGGDGPDLNTVKGTVTFNGTPVENGRILFRMTGGDMKGYSAEITNGSYNAQVEAGEVKVEITATRDTGKVDDMGGTSTPVPIMEMYIPPRYNSATELTKTVESGSNSFDFALEGDAAPAK